MENDDRRTPGQRLRGLRTDLNWTQGDLAEKLGTTRSYVSQLENGATIGPSTAAKLAEVFRCSEATFLEESFVSFAKVRYRWRNQALEPAGDYGIAQSERPAHLPYS